MGPSFLDPIQCSAVLPLRPPTADHFMNSQMRIRGNKVTRRNRSDVLLLFSSFSFSTEILMPCPPSQVVLSTRTKTKTLLSNFDVLHLLREYESGHLARQKTALRIKKEEEEGADSSPSALLNLNLLQLQEEVCENLRTVEFEVRYICMEPPQFVDMLFLRVHNDTASHRTYHSIASHLIATLA